MVLSVLLTGWSNKLSLGHQCRQRGSTSALNAIKRQPEHHCVIVIPVTAAGGPIVVEDALIPVTGADATLNYALLQQLT